MAPLLLLVVLGGCAAGANARKGASPTHSPQRTVIYAAPVLQVSPGRTDRQGVLRVRLPKGRSGCGHDARVSKVTAERGKYFVQVIYSATGPLPYRACSSTRTVDIPFTVPGTLVGHAVSVNGMTLWQLDGSDFRKCDTDLGCDPPADHCDRAWRDAALDQFDVPRHSRISTRACDGHWMVLDIDVGASVCTQINAAANGCTPTSNVRRYFLVFGKDGWVRIAGTRRAGCTDVQAADPVFPTALCQDLTAP